MNLVDLLGKTVRGVTYTASDGLHIAFSDGTSLRVVIERDDTQIPEYVLAYEVNKPT